MCIRDRFQIGVRLTEELQFHLLEFADAEDEVTRSDLVSERLTDLSHAERQLFAGGTLDIGKVYKDAPVSYTHLDVYERQIRNCWEALSCISAMTSMTAACVLPSAICERA